MLVYAPIGRSKLDHWSIESPQYIQIAPCELVITVYFTNQRDSSEINTYEYIIMSRFQWFTTAFIEQLAIAILARLAVIDAVAVADIEAVGGTKTPNGVLYKARKRPRKSPIKGACVDLGCDRPNDLGTATKAIAAHAIAMGSTAIFEDAGAMQKVMDQGIDGDHGFAGLEPMRAVV